VTPVDTWLLRCSDTCVAADLRRRDTLFDPSSTEIHEPDDHRYLDSIGHGHVVVDLGTSPELSP